MICRKYLFCVNKRMFHNCWCYYYCCYYCHHYFIWDPYKLKYIFKDWHIMKLRNIRFQTWTPAFFFFNTATVHLIRRQAFSKFTTLRTRFWTLSAHPFTGGARLMPSPHPHPETQVHLFGDMNLFFLPPPLPPFFYQVFMWFQDVVRIENHSFKVFLYKACSTAYQLAAGQESRTLGPTQDLLSQNLHFNKVPREDMCALKVEKYYFKTVRTPAF